MSSDCSAWAVANSRLIAHRVSSDGRIDMELDSELENAGWFHVYDAYNDGVLSGPEDRVTIGGDKYEDRTTCAVETRNPTIVRGNRRYERLFADAKRNIIQYYAGRYMSPDGERALPPHNDAFFGEWGNFTEKQDDSTCVTGFKVEQGDRYCQNDQRAGVVVTMVDIDYDSYPRGMDVLIDAVNTANLLKTAAEHQHIDRSEIQWWNGMCRAYGRCRLAYPYPLYYTPEINLLTEWTGIHTWVERVSDVCSWSAYHFTGLQAWAMAQLSDQSLDVRDN